MTSLTIRNLDESLKSRLRQQAARHGCSMEQEARNILRQAVEESVPGADFAQKIHRRFASFELEALPVPERQAARVPNVVKD